MSHIRTFLKSATLAGLLALSPAVSLLAHGFQAGDLKIDHPWTRATPGGASTAAGYVKITNNGKEADRLISASAEGTDKVEVHEMSMDNNVMRMRQLKDGIEIKPGETAELKPGSYHLMIIGVKTPFKEGTMVKGTLVFEKAGTVPVEFKVEAMGGGGSAGGHKGH
jgi:copper(I)-binding protein